MSGPTKREDIEVFSQHCVFMRSIYLHPKILYEASTDADRQRLNQTAEIFFGDLHQVLVEYIILQICKCTDPAQDFKKNDNHTLAFLLQHYDLKNDPTIGSRLTALEASIYSFRQALLPARNKLIGHSDRNAIMAGVPLGDAPEEAWDQFWSDLDEIVSLIYGRVMGTSWSLGEVAMISDANGVLQALAHAAHFDALLGDADPIVAHRAAALI